ncbi:Uncharacterised protein [Weissella viridescens]|uniref:Uncharacterized protein n=1 Tax=Weissella viridescens TaxID=1629 RepID=A0A380P1J0_WEIVI|nr:Uncharacterised protein [Weissella viridescens]
MWHDLDTHGGTPAVSYRSFGPWQYRQPRTATPQLMSYIVGAGNLYTTPDDYLKFQRGLHNSQILDVHGYEQLTHQPNRPNNGYSGGMYHRRHGKLKKVYGYLRDTHYRNWVQLSSDSQYGIILLRIKVVHQWGSNVPHMKYYNSFPINLMLNKNTGLLCVALPAFLFTFEKFINLFQGRFSFWHGLPHWIIMD